MRSAFNRRAVVGTAAMTTAAIWLCAPALGQTATAADAPSASSDIIVTARRVEESLQDVPISITVFNQTELDDRNVVSGSDLAIYTPSLVANSRFGNDNTSFSIRGAVQEARTTASVATYLADVVALRGNPGGTTSGDGAGPGSFFDLQNVQVLKGPQGTLFGRNTTGGAILFVPRRPTDQVGGYVEGSIGNYDMRRLQGVINLPVSDTIRFRAGADWQDRDGYIRNLSPVGPRRFADLNYVTARASLVVDLTPDLENYTIGTYTRSRNNGISAHLEGAFPTANGRATAFGNLAAQALVRQAPGGRFSTENSIADPVSRVESFQIINTTTWRASDEMTIKNIASYGELKAILRYDPYSTYFPLGATYQAGNGTIFPVAPQFRGSVVGFATLQALPAGIADQYTMTEELQIQRTDGALAWQAGAYFEQSDALRPTGTQGPSGGLVCTDIAALQCQDVLGAVQGIEGRAGSMQSQDSQTRIRNLALYAQGTYKLSSQLSFTAGVRYTWDKTDTLAHLGLIRFPAANDPRLYCLTLAGPLGPVGNNFSNALAAGATAVNNALGDACEVRLQRKSNAPTWTLGLDYKPIDDVLLYGKFSRGYRQGSTNPFAATGFQTYRPEKLDAFELGAKTSWRGAVPGYVNLAGYYNDFKSVQVTAAAVDLLGRISPNSYVTNGTSRVKGAEVEAGVTLFDQLRLSTSYSYLDSKLKSLAVGVLPTPSVYNLLLPVSVVGRPLPFSPRHTLTVSANYALPVAASVGRISAGGTYSYSSRSYATFANFATGAGLLNARSLVNLNLNWDSVGGSPIDLSLFGTNIFSKRYIINANEAVSSGFFTRTYGPPAMYGLRIKYNFGS